MPSGKIITPSMRGRKKDQGIVPTKDPPAVVQNIGQQNLNTELKIDNAKEQVYRPEALVPNQGQQEPSHNKATSKSSRKAATSTPKQGGKRPRNSNSPARTQTPTKPPKPHHPLTGSAKKTKKGSDSPAHNRTPGSATKRRTMSMVREQEKRDISSQKKPRKKNSIDGGNVTPGAKRRLNDKHGQPCEVCTSTVGTANHECGYNLCYYCTQRKLKTGLDGCLMCCEESSIPQAYKEGALALRRERALALRATKS